CRKDPNHSASLRPLDAFLCWNYCRTKRSGPVGLRRRHSNTEFELYRPGSYIPTRPRWATGTSFPPSPLTTRRNRRHSGMKPRLLDDCPSEESQDSASGHRPGCTSGRFNEPPELPDCDFRGAHEKRLRDLHFMLWAFSLQHPLVPFVLN